MPVEKNPPGDIPDNLAFVKYANKPGAYSFTHPEGWAQTGTGTHVRFTDKLNGVTVDSSRANQAPTVATARTKDVPRLKNSIPAFELRSVSVVALPGGNGVHLVFRRNSEPDQVTGKVFRDEVEEYAVQSHGRLIRMDLYGPVGADNVDAYRTMSQSLAVR
ncbi:lipoprotein [soil metagenome]